MNKIVVATDSTTCIPQRMRDELNIKMAPITIIIGDKEYRDLIDITPDEFYRRVREEGIVATTSGSIVGEFVKIYEQLSGKVAGIVVIVLSPNMPSAGYDSAVHAARLVPEVKVEVLDSGWVLPAEGFIALAAARAAAKGANMATVVQAARNASSKMNMFIVPENLKYFKRLGRFIMPGTEADWADLQPVLTQRGGKISREENCNKGRGIPRMLELVKERAQQDSPLHLTVFHADNPQKAAEVREQIAKYVHCDELYISLLTPVVGIHVGPGTVGVAFYNE